MDQAPPYSPTPLSPQSRRRWRRRLLVALLLLILASGSVIFVYYISASTELEEAVAELDRLDPGWRLFEIETKRKLVPIANNSAQHILAIAQAYGTPVIELEKTFGKILKPQIKLDEPQAALLEQKLERSRQAVEEARQLKDMPEGRLPINSNYKLTVLNFSRLLMWDAFRRAQNGDADGALESCLAVQNTARSMGDDPSLMAQLVRSACDGVAARAVERTFAQCDFPKTSVPMMNLMQANMAKELQELSFLTAIRTERAWIHELFQDYVDGKIDQNMFAVNLSKGVANFIDAALLQGFPGYLTHQRVLLLHCYTDIIEALKLPPVEQEARLQILKKKAQQGSRLVLGGVSYLLGRREEMQRQKAKLVCVYVAIAAERYRIDRNIWPTSLEDMVASDFLDAIPADPYDEQPLRLKRTDDGLIIYSIGPDKIDDGGNIDAVPGSFGKDEGFRLWDVAKRRQAATAAESK